MDILGISAFYHDSAAVLLRDGHILAAAQEERFSRKKHDAGLPVQAMRWCLSAAGNPARLDAVAFYDKPLLKLHRLLSSWMAAAPGGLPAAHAALPVFLRKKLWVPLLIEEALEGMGVTAPPPIFPEHHLSHAASAFFPSPFPRAAVLTVDGVGEWASSTLGRGEGRQLELLAEQRFPHSLGLLYTAFTTFCGFAANDGEYKLMGLAPFGAPRFVDTILEHLVDLKDDGSFRLNLAHFAFHRGLTMTGPGFERLFDGPPRAPEGPLTRRELDLARSMQAVTEEILLRSARHGKVLTGERHLCLAGGVALNCVANGRLLREGPFDDLWIQPAAGDAGGALGAALIAWHTLEGQPREPSTGTMQAARLGPGFSDGEIAAFLAAGGHPARHLTAECWAPTVAALLASGRVVALFDGRMEYGPRALGHRSILADPRSPGMQALLNRKVKLREGFRPFAPAALAERAAEHFDLDRPSPFMLLVARVRGWQAPDEPQGDDLGARLRALVSPLPAVTHVDGSARVQTVDAADHPRFHALLSTFAHQTGCPVLVNTSFNLRDEPIVCTPADALRTFLRSEIDALVLGDHLLLKEEQPMAPGPDAWLPPSPWDWARWPGLDGVAS
ncbi:MAG: carbamoyltransferase N-terminal domain-containing protein [Pseudomonadota bacterium]